MSELSLARLRTDGQAFTQEISRESYLAHSGHKPVAELTPIYEKYADVLGRDALDLTLECDELSIYRQGTDARTDQALVHRQPVLHRENSKF